MAGEIVRSIVFTKIDIQRHPRLSPIGNHLIPHLFVTDAQCDQFSKMSRYILGGILQNPSLIGGKTSAVIEGKIIRIGFMESFPPFCKSVTVNRRIVSAHFHACHPDPLTADVAEIQFRNITSLHFAHNNRISSDKRDIFQSRPAYIESIFQKGVNCMTDPLILFRISKEIGSLFRNEISAFLRFEIFFDTFGDHSQIKRILSCGNFTGGNNFYFTAAHKFQMGSQIVCKISLPGILTHNDHIAKIDLYFRGRKNCSGKY